MNQPIITLPKYVDKIGKNFTIHITPIYSNKKLRTNYETSRVKNNSFEVFGENGSFFWSVFGERCHIDVEPSKKDTILRGDGPYKYINNFK